LSQSESGQCTVFERLECCRGTVAYKMEGERRSLFLMTRFIGAIWQR
jgi:hypothetical protein